MNKNGLVDVWRVRNKGEKQYTWVKVTDNMVCGARLDRFYLGKIWNNRVMNVFHSPNAFSDHHMVGLDLNMKELSRCTYYILWVYSNTQ